MRCITAVVVASVLACCATQAPVPSPDEHGGTVAILLDRTYGSWREVYSRREGTMSGSPEVAKRASLVIDSRFLVRLRFDSGRSVDVDLSFPQGTPISDASMALARALAQNGVDVVPVPEFGVVRINFAPGLREVFTGGSDGLTAEVHLGTRADFRRRDKIGLPESPTGATLREWSAAEHADAPAEAAAPVVGRGSDSNASSQVIRGR